MNEIREKRKDTPNYQKEMTLDNVENTDQSQEIKKKLQSKFAEIGRKTMKKPMQKAASEDSFKSDKSF